MYRYGYKTELGYKRMKNFLIKKAQENGLHSEEKKQTKAKSKALNNAMKGVSASIEKARRKVYGKDAHLTGKTAIEAEYKHWKSIRDKEKLSGLSLIK